MKVALALASLTLVVASCQKDLSSKIVSASVVTASNAGLPPLPCHTTSFTIDGSDKPGEVPSFRFTKTLYPDTRVKTIYMLSRANPIYASYKPQAWELKGTFYYNTYSAVFNGTKELWEYYKMPGGGAGKRSITKKKVSLQFNFLWGGIDSEVGGDAGKCYGVDNLLTGQNAVSIYATSGDIIVGAGSDDPQKWLHLNWDANSYSLEPVEPADYKSMTILRYYYQAGHDNPNQQISYQPSQNWISFEYSLVEVMQWIPVSFVLTGERSGVSVEFHPFNTPYTIKQSQGYYNQKYDDKGNMTSYTYGNNIPQRTTWYCK